MSSDLVCQVCSEECSFLYVCCSNEGDSESQPKKACKKLVCNMCSHSCEDRYLGCIKVWCLFHDENRCQECGSSEPRCRECSDECEIEKCICIDCVNEITSAQRKEEWEAYKATGRCYPLTKKAKK